MLHENDIAARTADRPPTVEDLHLNGVAVRVLESCHSLWIFEPARARFRRVPRGTRLDMPSAENEWTRVLPPRARRLVGGLLGRAERGRHPGPAVLAPRRPLPPLLQRPDRRDLGRGAPADAGQRRRRGLGPRAANLSARPLTLGTRCERCPADPTSPTSSNLRRRLPAGGAGVGGSWPASSWSGPPSAWPSPPTTAWGRCRAPSGWKGRAKTFTLDDVRAGRPPVALEALRGKPVVLNFFASWCGPCMREMPALQAMSERYQGQGPLRRHDLQRPAGGGHGRDRTDRRDLPRRLRPVERRGRRLRRAGDADDVLHRARRQPGRAQGRRDLRGPAPDGDRPPLRLGRRPSPSSAGASGAAAPARPGWRCCRTGRRPCRRRRSGRPTAR